MLGNTVKTCAIFILDYESPALPLSYRPVFSAEFNQAMARVINSKARRQVMQS
jgi:hypothetical protein